MTNNQEIFNKKYPKKRKEIEFEDKKFEGQLVIEDYPELELLYLQNIKNVDKVILKNLPKLKECTFWDCGLKELLIENCPQIKELNVRRNLLTSLEFIKDLKNLEELELDGNPQLSELLEPYEDDWQAYQKDLQESNQDNQELLRTIRVLEKEKEFLNTKYDELKKFLKGILVSLSQKEKNELAFQLDNKIQRRESITAPGMTKQLVLNTGKVIKSWKEIRKELESELVESKAKIEELERELKNKTTLYQRKEVELITQQTLAEELKRQWVNAIQESAKSEPVEKARWEQKANELEKQLDETKKKEYLLEGELNALKDEVQHLRSLQKQNPNQDLINQLLDNYELIQQKPQILTKIKELLGIKRMFLNAREQTIVSLRQCCDILEAANINKYAKREEVAKSISAIGKVANQWSFGVVEAIGESSALANTRQKRKFAIKSSDIFQGFLSEEEKNLQLFKKTYNLLLNSLSNLVIEKEQEPSLFSLRYRIYDIATNIWQGKAHLETGDMKDAISALQTNLLNLQDELKQQEKSLEKLNANQTQSLVLVPPKSN